MNNIAFVGYFFSHNQHRNYSESETLNYKDYYESIIQYLENFCDRNLLFITDDETYNLLSNKIKKSNCIIKLNYEDTLSYRNYNQILNEKFNPKNDILSSSLLFGTLSLNY